MENRLIKKASYELLENSISIYLAINQKEDVFDIIRIIGSKEEGINSLDEYICNSKSGNNFGYKVFISFNISNEYYEKQFGEFINEEKIENDTKSKLEKLKKEYVNDINSIKYISEFTYDHYGLSISDCLMEDDEIVTLIYDGYLATTDDLILTIINYLKENNIELKKENSLIADDLQLCRRF